MPLSALLLVLGAAVCHSTWNLMVKSERRPIMVQTGALAVGVVLASPVLLLYPLGDLTWTAWLLVLLSALFETGYVFALSTDLSLRVAIPGDVERMPAPALAVAG